MSEQGQQTGAASERSSVLGPDGPFHCVPPLLAGAGVETRMCLSDSKGFM